MTVFKPGLTSEIANLGASSTFICGQMMKNLLHTYRTLERGSVFVTFSVTCTQPAQWSKIQEKSPSETFTVWENNERLIRTQPAQWSKIQEKSPSETFTVWEINERLIRTQPAQWSKIQKSHHQKLLLSERSTNGLFALSLHNDPKFRRVTIRNFYCLRDQQTAYR